MTVAPPQDLHTADPAGSGTAQPPQIGPGRRVHRPGGPARIVGLDIARGLAVLGMAAAHSAVYPVEEGSSGHFTWLDLVQGRPAMLFALLAGVSIALMTGRHRVPSAAERGRLRLQLAGRGMVIFTIGLCLELLATNIDVILTFYGAIYAVSMVFIGMRVRSLLIWAAALALAGPAVQAAATALAPGAFGTGAELLLYGQYSFSAWTALMLTGLALGRLDITRLRTASVALAVGVLLSVIGYTAGALWEEHAPEDAGGSGSMYSSDSVFSPSSSASLSAVTGLPDIVPGEQADLEGKVCHDEQGYLFCFPGDDTDLWSDDDTSADGPDSAEGPGSAEAPDPALDQDWTAEDDGGWPAYIDEVTDSEPGWSMLHAFLSSGPHSGGSMEILGSGGLALAITALLLLTGRYLRYALAPLAAVGSLPLTAYAAHVVVIWAVLGPSAWESRPWLFWAIASGLLVTCFLWRLLIGRGPLERLARMGARRLAG